MLLLVLLLPLLALVLVLLRVAVVFVVPPVVLVMVMLMCTSTTVLFSIRWCIKQGQQLLQDLLLEGNVQHKACMGEVWVVHHH